MADAFENEGMMRDDKVRAYIRGVLSDGGRHVKRKQHFSDLSCGIFTDHEAVVVPFRRQSAGQECIEIAVNFVDGSHRVLL